MNSKKPCMPKMNANLSYAATTQRKAVNLGKTNTRMGNLEASLKAKVGKQNATAKAAKFNKTVAAKSGRKTATKRGKK